MRLVNLALALWLLAASTSTQAQTATYDFSGYTTSWSGPNAVADGTPVTGSFTFDYTPSSGTTTSGTIGDPAGWSIRALTGSFYGPPPGIQPFSDSFQVGALTFSSSPTSFQNYHDAVGVPGLFNGYTDDVYQNGSYFTSLFVFQNYVSAPTYSAAGFPIFPQTVEIGRFESLVYPTGAMTVGAFRITSVSPVSAVPEPSTYIAMLMGLGILGLIGLRQKSKESDCVPFAKLRA
jgi:hypothetical protein